MCRMVEDWSFQGILALRVLKLGMVFVCMVNGVGLYDRWTLLVQGLPYWPDRLTFDVCQEFYWMNLLVFIYCYAWWVDSHNNIMFNCIIDYTINIFVKWTCTFLWYKSGNEQTADGKQSPSHIDIRNTKNVTSVLPRSLPNILNHFRALLDHFQVKVFKRSNSSGKRSIVLNKFRALLENDHCPQKLRKKSFRAVLDYIRALLEK